MSERPFEAGQRVVASLFGVGTVIEHPHPTLGEEFTLVRWDTSPPTDYNEGKNPAIVRTEWLLPAPRARTRD